MPASSSQQGAAAAAPTQPPPRCRSPRAARSAAAGVGGCRRGRRRHRRRRRPARQHAGRPPGRRPAGRTGRRAHHDPGAHPRHPRPGRGPGDPVSKGAVDLTLRGAHEQGRAALLDALPDLRRDLEAAGLSLLAPGGRPRQRRRLARPAQSRSSRPPTQQQGFGDRGRPGPGREPVTTLGRVCRYRSSGPTPSPNRSTSSGVDVPRLRRRDRPMPDAVSGTTGTTYTPGASTTVDAQGPGEPEGHVPQAPGRPDEVPGPGEPGEQQRVHGADGDLHPGGEARGDRRPERLAAGPAASPAAPAPSSAAPSATPTRTGPRRPALVTSVRLGSSTTEASAMIGGVSVSMGRITEVASTPPRPEPGPDLHPDTDRLPAARRPHT